MANKMSTNMPYPSGKESVSTSSKIRPSFSKTSTNIPTNTAAKGSPNPSAASKPANIKSVFGTPTKQKK